MIDMPEKTCSTCQCNKVCDHNKHGFENCGNYISDDLLPRAEVAREIFNEFEKLVIKIRYDADYSIFDMQREFAELKKKYTEEGK